MTANVGRWLGTFSHRSTKTLSVRTDRGEAVLTAWFEGADLASPDVPVLSESAKMGIRTFAVFRDFATGRQEELLQGTAKVIVINRVVVLIAPKHGATAYLQARDHRRRLGT
jgi:hypothetical protein